MSDTQVVPNITFNEIPAAPYYRPSNLVEVRPTFGSVGILPLPARNLIIAQMTSSGTATAGAVYPNIIQPQQATALGGPGSMAEGAVIAYLQAGGSGIPLDLICIADASGATKASLPVTFSGTYTGAGTTALQICGVRFFTGTLSTDTPANTCAEFVALVNADPQMPVTAAQGTGGSNGVMTLTAKNGGTEANAITVVVSPAPGDALPPGMAVSVGTLTAGTTNPSIASAISAIAGTWYTAICAPFQDSTNVAALTAELARRFTATVREDARAYLPLLGTYSQQLSAAAAANSQYVAGGGLTAPGSMPWQIAGAMMGVAEPSLVADPSLEIVDVVLPGIVGPQQSNRPNDAEQELLLAGGVTTFNMHSDGSLAIQRLVTTYNTNAQGVADRNTYLPMSETAVASRIRYDWRNYLKLIYPSNKLAPDGSLAAQYNSNVLTPNRAKGSWAVRILVYAKNGWIVNEAADANVAVFQIDANDRNRLTYQVQYTRIGNEIVDAGVMEFVAQ